MLLGVHEQYQGENATTPVATLGRYPLTVITREFKGGVIKPTNLVPALNNLCKGVWAAGLIANVSFKLSVADVESGAWEIYVSQLCRFLVDNKRVNSTILTFWHEPEDDAQDSYPNGTNKTGLAFRDGAHFVSYFDTIHAWCKAVSPGITTSHAALGYGYREHVGGPGDKSAFVTDPSAWVTKADIHAIDIYNGRSFSLEPVLGDMQAFKRWMSSRPGAPGPVSWGVSERGWTASTADSAARARAITREFEWLASLPSDHRPLFYIVWLTEGVENDQALKPDDRMREAINNGFALNGLPDTPEEPSEPQPEPTPTTIECPLCHGAGTVPGGEYVITTTVKVTR